jgi:hypothetical protein
MVTFRRTVRRAAWAATLVALTCAVSSCGAADSAGDAAGGQTAGPAPDATTSAATELQIAVTDGKDATTTWQLTCDPPGGTHPDPATACAALAEHPDALKPVARDATCTMQYGGDDTATVHGTYQGKAVSARFSLSNGCQISRWTALVPLLPATGSGAEKLVKP